MWPQKNACDPMALIDCSSLVSKLQSYFLAMYRMYYNFFLVSKVKCHHICSVCRAEFHATFMYYAFR